MLYRKIIAVCSQIHTKHINTLCGQNVELLNVKLVVHIVTSSLCTVTLPWLLTEHVTFATLHSTLTPQQSAPPHTTLPKQETPSHTNALSHLQQHSESKCQYSQYALHAHDFPHPEPTERQGEKLSDSYGKRIGL